MVSTSTYFTRHIIDGVTKQIFLLDFVDSSDGAVALSEDGDFIAEPVTVNEQAFSTDDIEPGDCSAATLSCVLNNTDRRFYGFTFGRAQSYIGVLSDASPLVDAESILTITGVGILHIYRDGATAATYTPDGGSAITITGSANANYAIANGSYIYLIDPNGNGWKIATSDGAYTTFTPSDFMTNKAARGVIESLSSSNLYIHKDGMEYTYDLCPCGLFNILKPNNTTVRELHITDAYDNIKLLDADASAWARSLVMTPSSPKTNADIINGVCTQCGLVFDSDYAPYVIATTYTENRFSNNFISYREIVSQIAKDCGCFAVASRYEGKLGLRPADGNTANYEYIYANRIVADGLLMADYSTNDVSEVILKKQDGTSVSESTGVGSDNPMVVFGGALLNSISTALKSRTGNILKYNPCEVSLTELNPAVECGDNVYVRPSLNMALPIVKSTTFNGVTWKITPDGRVTATGRSNGNSYCQLSKGVYSLPGEYTVTFFGKHLNADLIVYSVADGTYGTIYSGDGTESVTFTITANRAIVLKFDNLSTTEDADIDGYFMLTMVGYTPQTYVEPLGSFDIPVMRQSILWNGKTYGNIIATGNQYRLPPTTEEQNDYNVTVANQPEWDETASDNTVWKMQRLPNGTTIGIASKNYTLNFTTAWGNVYRATVSAIKLPTGYTYPKIFAQVGADGNMNINGATLYTYSCASGETPVYYAVRPVSASSVKIAVTYVFIAL